MKQIHYIVTLLGIISLGLLSTICTAAGIHKLVDEHGHIIFTNNIAQPTIKIRPKKFDPIISSRQINKVVASYPKINKSLQDQRDVKRRQILSQELANETRLLEDTLKTIDLTLRKQRVIHQIIHSLYRVTLIFFNYAIRPLLMNVI